MLPHRVTFARGLASRHSGEILAGFRHAAGLTARQRRHVTLALRATIAAMPRRARVVTWNGKDIPPELLELPAGRYVIESVEEEAPVLTPEEEAGIEAALNSHRKGRVVGAKRARQIIEAARRR